MNYIEYLKQQLINYGLMCLTANIVAPIAIYFEWREPILFPTAHIIGFSIAYIFLCPLYQIWFDSLKK
jgi:hypothetical protein